MSPENIRAVILSFCEAVDRAHEAHCNQGKGGQQVPFHDDFCPGSIAPSGMSRLRWWARAMRQAINVPDAWKSVVEERRALELVAEFARDMRMAAHTDQSKLEGEAAGRLDDALRELSRARGEHE